MELFSIRIQRTFQLVSTESPEARERILYGNFLKINKEVKDMIAEIQEFNKNKRE